MGARVRPVPADCCGRYLGGAARVCGLVRIFATSFDGLRAGLC